MIRDEPSRVHDIPRTWAPAVKSSSFRKAVTPSDSTIQIDPENAPGSDTAAKRRPSGDHDTNPLLRFSLSSTSSLSWITLPSELTNFRNAPIVPPRGSMYAITSSRGDHAGVVAAAAVLTRTV